MAGIEVQSARPHSIQTWEYVTIFLLRIHILLLCDLGCSYIFQLIARLTFFGMINFRTFYFTTTLIDLFK